MKRFRPFVLPVAVLIGAATVSIAIVACGGGGANQTPASNCGAWSPSSVAESLRPGEQAQVALTYTACSNSGPSVIAVDATLSPYVQIAPTSTPPLSRGSTQVFTVTFSPLIGSSATTTSGNITLSSHALPIAFTIEQAPSSVSSGSSTASFQPPNGWGAVESTQGSSAVELYDPNQVAAISKGAEGLGPNLVVSILNNPDRLSMVDYANSFDDGWYRIYASREQRQVNGHNAIVVSDATAVVPHYPNTVAFIDMDSLVLFVSAEVMPTSDFNAFLMSLQF